MIYSMRESCSFLAVLDTMWGDEGDSPSWFPISPFNHSGKRLYSLTESKFPRVWVTNSCIEQVSHSNEHGKPNPIWLFNNLMMARDTELELLPLLVCGGVAQNTYKDSGYLHEGPVFYLPHPAARRWTIGMQGRAKDLISSMKHHRGTYNLKTWKVK